MSERAVRDLGADPVALAIVNEMMEASLELAGPKKAGAYLRVLASRVAASDSIVVDIRTAHPVAEKRAALNWLEKRIPAWLARHG